MLRDGGRNRALWWQEKSVQMAKSERNIHDSQERPSGVDFMKKEYSNHHSGQWLKGTQKRSLYCSAEKNANLKEGKG